MGVVGYLDPFEAREDQSFEEPDFLFRRKNGLKGLDTVAHRDVGQLDRARYLPW